MPDNLDLVTTRPGSIIRKVLVVDDTPANLIAFEAALEPSGCEVIVAASGKAALAYLLDHDVSLVLLDVNMPEMDGFETARWIRSRMRLAHVPILFISAFSHDDKGLLRAYELGAIDFLFKPIYPEVLRAKVQFFLELLHHQEEVVALRLEREYETKRHDYEARALRKEIDANEELVRLNNALRALDRSKDRFIGALADRLRDANTDELKRVADELLELSRVGSSEIKLRFESVDLRRAVSDALAKTRHLFEAASIELVVTVANQPLMVKGDLDRLVQAIMHLLLDAKHNTPDGGRVAIACLANDRFGLVIVEDNGAGVPLDQLSDLFTGPALGLAIAHRLVAHHDGVLTASSGGAGQGTTFVIKLPCV